MEKMDYGDLPLPDLDALEKAGKISPGPKEKVEKHADVPVYSEKIIHETPKEQAVSPGKHAFRPIGKSITRQLDKLQGKIKDKKKEYKKQLKFASKPSKEVSGEEGEAGGEEGEAGGENPRSPEENGPSYRSPSWKTRAKDKTADELRKIKEDIHKLRKEWHDTASALSEKLDNKYQRVAGKTKDLFEPTLHPEPLPVDFAKQMPIQVKQTKITKQEIPQTGIKNPSAAPSSAKMEKPSKPPLLSPEKKVEIKDSKVHFQDLEEEVKKLPDFETRQEILTKLQNFKEDLKPESLAEFEKGFIKAQDEIAKAQDEIAKQEQIAKQKNVIDQDLATFKKIHLKMREAVEKGKKLKFTGEEEIGVKSTMMHFKETSEETLLHIVQLAMKAIARNKEHSELIDPKLAQILETLLKDDLESKDWEKMKSFKQAKATLSTMLEEDKQAKAALTKNFNVFDELTSPNNLNKEEFQLNFLFAYRGIFKGDKTKTAAIQRTGQSIGLFEELEREFKSASLYKRYELLKMVANWVSKPEVNNEDWRQEGLRKQIGSLIKAAKNSGSPLLANFAETDIEKKLEAMEKVKAPVVSTALKASENPIDLNARLDWVAEGTEHNEQELLSKFASDLIQVSLRNFNSVAVSEYCTESKPGISQTARQSEQLANYVKEQISSEEKTPKEQANLINFYLKLQNKLIDPNNEVIDSASYAAIGYGLVGLSNVILKKIPDAEKRINDLMKNLIPSSLRMKTLEQFETASKSEQRKAVIPYLTIFQDAERYLDDLNPKDKKGLSKNIKVPAIRMRKLAAFQEATKLIRVQPLASSIMDTIFRE